MSDIATSGARPGPAGPPSSGQAGFHDFMSAFFTGVAVITSMDADGRPHGLTCTSLTSVSVQPPTLLVSLDASSGTLRAVRDAAGFVVHILDADGRPVAELFASGSRDRFDRTRWSPSPRVGLPLLCGVARAVAECRVVDLIPVGDHVLVLGRPAGIDRSVAAPLLYGERGYRRVESR